MTFSIVECKKIVDEALNEVPERTKEVLCRRFGIGNLSLGKRETLERIGQDYGITRERVRQIEAKGLKLIRESALFSKLERLLFGLKEFIDENGGLKKEDILETILAPEERYRPYLFFLLKIGEPFFYHPDSQIFYSFWRTKEEAPLLAQKVVDAFVDFFEKERRLLQKEEILEVGKTIVLKEIGKKLPETYIISYIEVTKKIEENPLGEYGLAFWPEVSPKGVREKAYFVLKKEGRPMHFRELARAIENYLQRPVQPNTLHNELIKNKEFVLVGRGTYALAEWGYKPGTVRDVIEAILKEKKALSKEEIIEEVKKQRLVKESTILLNLQHFNRREDGKYTL